jgi:hypothetical protein
MIHQSHVVVDVVALAVPAHIVYASRSTIDDRERWVDTFAPLLGSR